MNGRTLHYILRGWRSVFFFFFRVSAADRWMISVRVRPIHLHRRLTLCLHIAGWQVEVKLQPLQLLHTQEDYFWFRLMTLVCVCVAFPGGKLRMRLSSGLNMHLCLSPADSVVLMRRRRRRRGCICCAKLELLILHPMAGLPPPISDHATQQQWQQQNTTTTSPGEAGAVMVTALSDLQRLLMLPRAASYSAWHGLCESSATFKFTCSSLPLEVWGLIKIDEQMGGGGRKKWWERQQLSRVFIWWPITNLSSTRWDYDNGLRGGSKGVQPLIHQYLHTAAWAWGSYVTVTRVAGW